MIRHRRTLCTFAAIATCLIGAGCGNAGSSGSQAVGQPGEKEPSHSEGAAHGGISADTFAALERVLVAAEPMDDDLPDDAPTVNAAVARFDRACQQLNPQDELVANMRAYTCPLYEISTRQASAFASNTRDCWHGDTRACDSIAGFADTLTQLSNAYRGDDEAIRASGLDEDCVEAMVTNESDYEYLSEAANAITSIAYAGSVDDANEAIQTLDGLHRPDDEDDLEQFRAGCG